MIQADEHILFVSQAKVAVLIQQKESLKTSIQEKKIVVTTKRCLFFESLSNVVQEIEYEIMKSKKNKSQKKPQPEKSSRLSVNQFPEHSFPIDDRQAKIIISEQDSCHRYLHKLGLRNFIPSTSGIVILKNLPKHKYQLMSFPGLREAFHFTKAIECSKAWTAYEKYCLQKKVEINYLWTGIIVDIINNQNSVTLIDPDYFLTGNPQQIKSFQFLIDRIVFSHSFRHRYAICSSEICFYANQFLELFQEQTHSLIFEGAGMTDIFFREIFSDSLKLENLMHIDLSRNTITDSIFNCLIKIVRQTQLSNINLSYNQISLYQTNGFITLLKQARIAFNFDLSYNKINDYCVEVIQKFIIFPHNPPIEQINLSFNKFTPKGIWRLFHGNKRMEKYHNYMNFVIYPIPFKRQTFPNIPVNYPTPSNQMNYNIHSALIEEFKQQSFLKHTINEILNPMQTILRIVRNLEGKKLPRNKSDMQRMLSLSNQIDNFIYTPQVVENIYNLSSRIESFPFIMSPVTIKHFIKYVSDKLNEALFIRDHYSVKYLIKSFKKLGIDYHGYNNRIEKLKLRNTVLEKNICDVFNFQIDQVRINQLLDEITKQQLRLNLQGDAVEMVYYLKYYRDRQIERLLYEKYHPENYLYLQMADKNNELDDKIDEKDFYIPYEIKVEKKINENFYLHPWRANYIILSEIANSQYEECLKFLQESTKKEKFSVYFDRIEERVEFMKNQFKMFSYYKFKSSYLDLKINCARLLSMYNYIIQKNYYLQIPSISRKVAIQPEKVIYLTNPQKIKQQYHISNYKNIRHEARSAGFYNFEGKLTRYIYSDLLEMEFNKMLPFMNQIYKIIDDLSFTTPELIPNEIIFPIVEIIKQTRQSIYPQQLKQEFYLKMLSFRGGKHMDNTNILKHITFLSNYLRPPLELEKYIVAAVLANPEIKILETPISIVTNINIPSKQDIIAIQSQQYVDRDWFSNEKVMLELLKYNGKAELCIELLTKQTISIHIPESKKVIEVVHLLCQMLKNSIEDVEHFWLYKSEVGKNKEMQILEQNQYIGELMLDLSNKVNFLVFKRRIYSPELKYVFHKLSNKMINSLFCDWRYEYMSSRYFVDDQNMFENAAKMIIIDSVEEMDESTGLLQSEAQKKTEEAIKAKLTKLSSIYKGYLPEMSIKRSFLSQDELLPELKRLVTSKIIQKQYLNINSLKLSILKHYSGFQQFSSTNHTMTDKNVKSMRVSLNMLQINIESENELLRIGLQRIIVIIPKFKYLLISYHKHDGFKGHINIIGTENKIIGIAHEILTYCSMRCRIISSTLYNIYRYEKFKAIDSEKQGINEKRIRKIEQIQKKLQSLFLTVLNLDYIIYTQTNRYIKVISQRKIYANATMDRVPMQKQSHMEVQTNPISDKHMQLVENAFMKVFPNVYKADNSNILNDSYSQQLSFQSQKLNDSKQKQMNSDLKDATHKKQPDLSNQHVPEAKPLGQNTEDFNFSPITNAHRPSGRGAPKKRL